MATARVLNSAGQRTPKGRRWRPATVSALLNGRYDHGPRTAVPELEPTCRSSALPFRQLHEMPSPSSDWTARQPHARGWLG
ncbi:hypothetical protein I552_6792 [Mycobacterium xenopi 3993]|nr:hypothetical protein I552_6792 [Mycobacterium xenopi 3993]